MRIPWIETSERLPAADEECLIGKEGSYVCLIGTFKRQDNKPDGKPQGWLHGALEEITPLDGATRWCPLEQ